MASLEEDDVEIVRKVFDFYALPSAPYEVGPFRLDSRLLPHYIPNAGVRLSAPGLTVVYTGDTGPDPDLAELGRDADLFVVEATHRAPQPTDVSAPTEARMHLTALEAGSAAAAAGARRLLPLP